MIDEFLRRNTAELSGVEVGLLKNRRITLPGELTDLVSSKPVVSHHRLLHPNRAKVLKELGHKPASVEEAIGTILQSYRGKVLIKGATPQSILDGMAVIRRAYLNLITIEGWGENIPSFSVIGYVKSKADGYFFDMLHPDHLKNAPWDQKPQLGIFVEGIDKFSFKADAQYFAQAIKEQFLPKDERYSDGEIHRAVVVTNNRGFATPQDKKRASHAWQLDEADLRAISRRYGKIDDEYAVKSQLAKEAILEKYSDDEVFVLNRRNQKVGQVPIGRNTGNFLFKIRQEHGHHAVFTFPREDTSRIPDLFYRLAGILYTPKDPDKEIPDEATLPNVLGGH